MTRHARVVVVAASTLVLLTMGMRQSLGLFLKPVVDDLGTDRESFALALASLNLVVGLPLAAMAADRLGPRRIVALAGILMTGGFLVASQAVTIVGFGLSLAVLVGLAVSGTSFVVVIGAVGKAVPTHRQSFAFGTVTAGASFGMFAVVPLVQAMIDLVGWRSTMVAIAGVSLIIVVVAARLLPADDTTRLGATPDTRSLTHAVSAAFANGSYLLLILGFFVCGFHVAFIASHLPAYLTDEGLSSTTAALALSLVGLFNIAGSFGAGWLGAKYPRRTLLSVLYLSRALLMAAFLAVPISATTALLFGAIMGVLWLSTVPLTSGLVAALFGPRYLSTLFGFVFLGHQLGAFLGVWLGGRIFDTTGGYRPVWAIAVALGVAAALIHLPISTPPLRESSVTPAPATA